MRFLSRVVSLRSWRFRVTTGRKTRAILLFSYNSGTFPIKGCFFDVVASTFNWDVTLWIYMFWSLIFWSSRDHHSGWFRNGSGCFFTLWHVKKSMVIRIMAYLVSRSFQNPVLITLRCKVVSFCCDDEGCLFDVVIIQTEITLLLKLLQYSRYRWRLKKMTSSMARLRNEKCKRNIKWNVM